ncbi:TonB-dependent receptor [Flavobacteriaceae bacterium]|nr:TonB-dependent receptor [Flavobacteriaceae bacterium]MDB4595886.1 TonB-dependent receptor [Flavobacteriaceae bacterium]
MLGYINKIFLIFPLFIFSNVQDSIQKIDLDNVIVKSTKINSNKKEIPLSVSIKNFRDEKNYNSQSSFSDFTRNTPGLFTSSSNNFSQDLRISIRGFGARSAFGIRGIKLIVDGIPETTPDGQSQLDNLPLGLVSSVEILRGPTANLYGNSSGGVISINTLTKSSEKHYGYSGIFGAYQYQSLQRTRILDWNSSSLIIHYDKRRSNGYRDQSGYKSNILNLKYINDLDNKNKIVWQINYTDSPYAYDAGGLKLSEVENDRRQARKNNIDYDTYEKVKHLKTGVSWNHKRNENSFFDSYFFYQKRDFFTKLPFNFGGVISLDRDYYGLGTKYTKRYALDNRNRTLVLGLDYLNQSDERKRYKNDLGVKGEITFDQIERFKSTGLYMLSQTSYDSGFLVRYGIRYDVNIIRTDSSSSIMLDKLNPSIGLSYKVSSNDNIFFSFGTSFETPTLNELSNNPNGEGLNENLKSSSSLNYEIGWRKSVSNLTLEAIAYVISSENEILPYELEEFPGKNFYQNVGSTSRYGVELNSQLSFKGGRINLSYTLSKNKFEDFIIDNNNLADNLIPGIPSQMLDLDLIFKLSRGRFLIISNRLIGERYADNANETLISSYNLLNIKYSKEIFKKSEIFLGVNNAFNQEYFDNIRINAFGKRYYEPAPKRNFYFGINLSF